MSRIPKEKAVQFVIVLGLMAVLAAPLEAQNLTGEIDGRVTDISGAAIPGAAVSVINVDTKQVTRTIKTAGQGDYSLTLLPVGTYIVTVKAPGFAAQHSGPETLGVGDALQQNFSMPLVGVDAQITVTSTPEGPNLENNQNSTTISNIQVNELALNTRNFAQLIELAPGVIYNGPNELYPGMTTSTGAASPSNFAIDGLQYAQITWLLDGSDILNHNGNNQTSVYPSVDSVNQIKIIRGGYGAEYGGAGSAQVVIVSKTGGSQFHGDLYYFFRNQVLNANSFFNLLASPQLPRPTLRYNDYGATLGGPIFFPHIYSKANSKTFFFFSEEIRRIGTAPTQTFTNYPTMPQTLGYFQHKTTQSVAVTNSPYAGYNYKVATINATAQQYIKDLMNPALAVQQVNSPVDPQGVIIEQNSTTHDTQTLVRVDHQFSARLSAFIRFIDDPIFLMIPNQYNGATNGFPLASQSNVGTFGKNVEALITYTLSPNTVLQGEYSYQPYGISIVPTGTLLSKNSPDINITLPFPNTTGRVPNLAINGTPSWTTRGTADDEDEAHQTFLNVTHVQGKQNIIFGGNYEYTRRTANAGLTNAGAFTFTGAKNAATGVTAYEQAFSNFLSGTVNTFTQASVDALSITDSKLYEAYVQDDWRATPRLTMNLGVRYSIYGQFDDAFGHLGAFQPEFYNPANAPAVNTVNGTLCVNSTTNGCVGQTPNANYSKTNGIVQGGSSQAFGGAISTTPYTDFAPRFGFAYNLTGDGKASLRGGYGIFYNQTQLNLGMTEVDANPAYVQTSVYSAPTSFANPAAGATTNNVEGAYGQVRNWKQPYTQAFNLDLQVQMPHSVQLDIGYVGNNTMHLLMIDDFDQPLPGYYHQASGVAAYPTSGTTTAAINAYRPYLGYDGIERYSTRGFADYNGLQTSVNKKFSKRSLLSLNYTWSKSLSNVQTLFVAPQNTYDLKAEWGPSFQDRRNIFVTNFVYELPSLTRSRAFLRWPFGDWEVSGIVIAESGQWGSITQNSADPAGQGILATNSLANARLDMNGNPNVGGGRNVAQFFNTSVFAQVPAGLYRPGNEKRSSTEGPGEQVWNLDLFRNINLAHETRLQFRVEAYNLFNHVNYTTVNTAFNNTAFGQVTAADNNREMQLGVKFYY